MTGVWWFHEDGTPSWIPQEKMDPVAKDTLTALYKVSYEAKWGVDVDVSYRVGEQTMLRADGPAYLVNLDLDASGRLTGEPIASAPGDRPVNDDNVAAHPPASSGGATSAVPATNVNPIRGVPLSASLPGSKP